MKMIVVTKSDGTIVGATYAHEKKLAGQMEGGLFAGPGETLHEVDVPEEFSGMAGHTLHDKLKAHLGNKP